MQQGWHNLFRRLCDTPCGAAASSPVPGAAAPPRGGPPTPPLPCLLTAAAAGLSRLYEAGARARRNCYGRGLCKVQRLPAPVLSVGNLTVGGSGKTPVVAALARLLRRQGHRVVILSRGYGGRQKHVTCISNGSRILATPPAVGEEPYWLARALPGVAVYTGSDRYRAGLAAWCQLQPDLFLLDDGFQHLELHRDLDVVLLDAASPFGNGCILPRGPLREPAAALTQAQVLVLTRFDPARHLSRLAWFRQTYPGRLVLTAAIEPQTAVLQPQGLAQSPADLRHLPLMGFAGLARPEVFVRSLTDLGVELRGFAAFPDHHPYTPAEVQRLLDTSRTLGAAGLITTGKDWARLGERWQADIPLWVLEVEAVLDHPEAILDLLPAASANRPTANLPERRKMG